MNETTSRQIPYYETPESIRQMHELRWRAEAEKANLSRSIGDKLLRKNKITYLDLMRDEADRDNVEFDSKQKAV